MENICLFSAFALIITGNIVITKAKEAKQGHNGNAPEAPAQCTGIIDLQFDDCSMNSTEFDVSIRKKVPCIENANYKLCTNLLNISVINNAPFSQFLIPGK